ncbi:hypothetical protein PFDSM3638_00110 [Pyrococcus furiosus DSM 3638]|uniref:Uncharacterized protein n=3 Tax=Pyrococcus furiosus TaxID=2261 RepID=Q8U4P3_PYRFU|nr:MULTISPECIES: hypothetical protein [Pyrococcus]AAL80161.1 hypothetical protein PF0037 [Pyrococcus furiosus DSM 3638]AFN04536.1 hypothetical protein PFC_08020 [Pyrococcus furiosus COM1]MDK2869180.1 hypothetical protein [Pyrococcus sp.]QEK77772.1 hypothetical protein PFDSM3638_00110 [Pyrococcus furiosus DSM 3638]
MTLLEYLKFWELKKAEEEVKGSEEKLNELLSIISQAKDREIVYRGLIVLENVLKQMNDIERLRSIEKILPTLVKILEKEKDERIILRATKCLNTLIAGIPITPKCFVRLGHAIKDIIKSKPNELILFELAEVVKSLRVLSKSPSVHDILSRLLKSRNIQLKTIGLRLFLNISHEVKDVLRELTFIIPSKDKFVLELGLDILEEISNVKITQETLDDFIAILTRVKNIALYGPPEFRERAKVIAEKIEENLREFYKNNLEEAKRKINELLKEEKFYEAIDLALAIGDTYILKWLADVLEKLEKKTIEINERVIPRPKVVGQKVRTGEMKTLKPMTLKDLKPPKEVYSETLKKAIESEDIDEVTSLLTKNPELVFDLIKKLKSEDKFERMDALWAILKAIESLDGKRLEIFQLAVQPLFEIAQCERNRWARLRAIKALAKLAAKADFGKDIVEHFIKYLHSQNFEVALTFFSYYFLEKYDEQVADIVLRRIEELIEKGHITVEIVLTLQSLAETMAKKDLPKLKSLVEKLIMLKKSEEVPQELQKAILHLLDLLAERMRDIVILPK